MNNFTISFSYKGTYFTSQVKKKKHEFTSLFAVSFDNGLEEMLNGKGLIFVDHGNKSMPIVYYPHYIKKDTQFEKVIWDAIHEVHDQCFFYGSNSIEFTNINLS